MNRPNSALLLAALFILFSAPGAQADTKSELETYFAAMDSADKVMGVIAQEMQTALGGIKAAMAKPNFDAGPLKAELDGFEARMTQQKAEVAALEVPAEAKAHHGYILQQYDTAILVLGETTPMLDIAVKVVQVRDDETLTDEQKKTALKALQAELMGHQGKVKELAGQGKQFFQQATSQRKSLSETYNLK